MINPLHRYLKRASTPPMTEEETVCRPFSVRDPFRRMEVAAGLTPPRLRAILNSLNDGGDPSAYLILAQEMEERDPHYAAVLHTRKQAVASLEPFVTLPADQAEEKIILQAVRRLVRDSLFSFLCYDLLDALGKGYSVVEIMWATEGDLWFPKAYYHKDPRWFRYDRIHGRSLERIGETEDERFPLSPYKYVIHEARIRSGLPLRAGLARLVATIYMLKSYTLNAWASFIDVAGLPMRLGKYDSSASAEDIEQLKKAVSYLGSDTGAVIPEAMQIEFIANQNTAGLSDLFLQLATYLDQQISKAVLGQTMTTDTGGSLAQAHVHNEVRKSLVRSDAHLLAHSLQRDLIRSFVLLNFGPQAPVPQLHFKIPQQEDRSLFIQAAKELIPLGLHLSEEEMRRRLGLD